MEIKDFYHGDSVIFPKKPEWTGTIIDIKPSVHDERGTCYEILLDHMPGVVGPVIPCYKGEFELAE